MRICFVSSELAPFAKAGGLGDVSAALPRYLHGAGHDVRVFVPFYARVAAPGREMVAVDFIQNVPVRMGPHTYHFSLFTTQLPNSTLWVYFVQCEPLYARPELYTSDVDEHMRFCLLTQIIGRHKRSCSRKLNYNVIERHLVIERLARPESAIPADHAGLDCTAAL